MCNGCNNIGPSSPGQTHLPRRAAGICRGAIGPTPFLHTYDSNGNMTADPDANLSGMTYNVLNLLSGYTNGANGYQTTFEYTASGEKMREVSKNGNVISAEKHYVGNVVYEGLMGPSRLLIDGGYVEITSTFSSMSYAYRFNVQDHQGNNRMVMDAIGTVLQVNHYDPYGQLLTAISSTPAVSQYKYGGKEWSPTSLSYDFGARNYLPAVPRWNSMDPLAEKYYSVSPYVYCAGNPVNLVDEEGRTTTDYYNLKGKKVYHLEDGKYDRFFVLEGDSVVEAIKADLVFPIPSPEVVNQMQEALSLTRKNKKEHGFRVGENGVPSIMVEGSEEEINNEQWLPAINDLHENKKAFVLYDVHTHPENINGSTNIPSANDIANVVGHAPGVIIGQELIQYSQTNQLGKTTVTNIFTPQIVFYNRTGAIGNPIDFKVFLKVVNKLNRK